MTMRRLLLLALVALAGPVPAATAGTGNDVSVANGWSAPLLVSVTGVQCMYENGTDGSALQALDGVFLWPQGVGGQTSVSAYVEDDGSWSDSCWRATSSEQSEFTLTAMDGLGNYAAATIDWSETENGLSANAVSPGSPFCFSLPGASAGGVASWSLELVSASPSANCAGVAPEQPVMQS